MHVCRRFVVHSQRCCFFSNLTKSKHTKIDGFNQVLRATFHVIPEGANAFENIARKYANASEKNEIPHLQKFDVLRDDKKVGVFTVYQAYNSREGFENHRLSDHFVEFVHSSGPLMKADVDLQEFKSLYPPQDEWGLTSPGLDKVPMMNMQVNFKTNDNEQEKVKEVTLKHCNDTMKVFATKYPEFRMYFLQNTMNHSDFQLILSTSTDSSSSILQSLKESQSYVEWANSIANVLQSPRVSRRYEVIT